jgi:hypothetical protein
MALVFIQPLTEISTRKWFWGVERGRRVRLTISPSLSRLSRQCEILNISQHYRPPKVCYGDSFTLWRRSVLPVRYELDCKYCYK